MSVLHPFIEDDPKLTSYGSTLQSCDFANSPIDVDWNENAFPFGCVHLLSHSVVEGFAFVAEHVVVSRIEARAALVAVAVLWWFYGPLW